jgi:oligoendopeptidase F
MTIATKNNSENIPQRADIEEKLKWDLSDLYKNDRAWEADYNKAQGIIESAKDFSGKLNESSKTLFDCLENRSNLLLICGNLFQYAKLNQDLDSRLSKYQAMTERASMIMSQANAAFSFVEPELLALDNARLEELASQFPEIDIYDFYIKELIRSRAHIRSAEVEEILARVDVIARGPNNIFAMLDNADIKYPSVTDENGNKVQLTKQRYSKFMESSDQRMRKEARKGFMSAYKDRINTIGATLSSAVSRDVFYTRARKFDSCLHRALDAFNIPISVYRSLLETTESDLVGFHKWMELRRKILKLDKIYLYDMYCPLFPEQNYEVAYDEAAKNVIEAVKPLGKKYGEVIKKGFDNRWVDVYETEGKRGGAYSWGNYSSHPYVLMNYNDTINNMFTLVHEMGHCLHSFLSNKNQPFQKAQYSIFVAEVASTLNEGLLLNYLLDKATDKQQKLFLLNRHIDNTFGTFFMQVLFSRFELAIHEIVESGEALSPDTLNNLWEKLQKKYFGSFVTIDEYARYNWARIPHFYMTFYVFQYATSFAASQAILKKFLAGEPGIIDKYLELLSSGGNDYPIEQLKKCGVDMTTPDPVKATLKLFADEVDEVERLTV